MKKFLLFFVTILIGSMTYGQVTTNGSSGLALTYPTLAAAISALNTATITSPVIITLDAGNPQTAPAGGYTITATGTVANTITINGSNNTITAFTPQASGILHDAIFEIIGGDYITINGFTMQENAANTTTAAGTNNMTEFGVALFYATTTNGAQYNTIKNCTISLNRTYQNTFGIYSNSTHSATSVTTSATATTAAGGNTGLTITGNSISNVNNGIVIVGPTAAADNNDAVTIGGAGNGNTITNYGTTGTFSGYANVSGTLNGILVRNTKNFTISYNTVSSSVGGVTAGTLNGIQIPAFSNAPTGAFTNSINNNSISLQSGLAGGAMNGINVLGTTASTTSTININNNDFHNFGHTVAGTAAITFITQGGTHLNQSISNNTFTNMSVNTTGSVTFISNNVTLPAAGTQNINNNAIVTGFGKTGAGGTVTVFTTNASSPTGSTINNNSNNFSNITITDATTLMGWSNTDGGTPAKTIQNNTFNNWTGGTSSITVMSLGYSAAGSIVSGNTITNITGQAAITGLIIGSSSAFNVYSNTIHHLSSTGTGGNVIGLSCTSGSNNIFQHEIYALSSTGASSTVTGLSVSGATLNSVYSNIIHGISGTGTTSPVATGMSVSSGTAVNIYKNKIYDISENGIISITSPAVNGLLISAGTTVTVSNNLIGDLKAPSASLTEAIRGISIASTSSTTTYNVYYNTVYMTGGSIGANFGSTGIFHNSSASSTTAALDLRNNVIVNNCTPSGSGLAVAFRRSSGVASMLSNYAATSNNNFFYAGTPSLSNLIYSDGTTSAQIIADYKTGVFTAGTIAPRDAASKTGIPPFLSTAGADPTFLHIDPNVQTAIESGGAVIASYDTDYDGDFRFGNASYSGAGTAPDMGADEFEGLPLQLCSGTPASSTIDGLAAVCSGKSTALTLSNNYTDIGITFEWASGTDSGGPYDTPLGTSPGQSTGSLTVPTYFICTIRCTETGEFFVTDEKAVGVNPLPSVSVDFPAASYCTPIGPAVALTASGAGTYSWSPAAGLNVTTGANVVASPSSTTTYTVAGTGGNGCVNTAISVITVGASVTSASATATPPSVCSGNNSQLQASALQSFNTPQASAYTFSTASGTSLQNMTGAINLVASGQDVTASPVTSIGFSFNFGGTDYTQFSASCNGVMGLGGSAVTGADGNNSTTYPTIVPMWDDMHTCTNGNVQYVLNTSGGTGNRILVVEWNYGNYAERSGTFTKTVQVWLYESTNQIKIVYGANTGALISGGTVGIVSSGTNYNDVNTSTGVNSTSTVQDANTVWPATGTTYIFTPTGAPVFTYLWAPTTFISGQQTLSNPVAGTVTVTTPYTVTITGNSGCSATANVTVNVVSGVSIVNQPVSISKCAGETATFTVNATGAGLSYQWRKGGGDISTLLNPSAGTNTLTLANVSDLDNGTYDVVISSSCGAPVTSDGSSTLTVKPLPSVSVTPTAAPYCVPGGSAVAITASGADTYAWSPAAGLNVTTGANVSASPSLTTTYTVTGTGLNGCTKTATSVITLGAAVSMTSVTASPSTICAGGSTVLTAVAAMESSPASYSFAASSDTYTSISGTAIPEAIGDDYGIGNLPIGFNFNYNGVAQTVFGVSSNGVILMGNTSSAWTSGFYSNALATNVNYIAPLWDDNNTTGASVQYLTTGTAGNRILTVQWTNMHVGGTGGGTQPTISMQALFYEANGNIKFIYGPTSAPLTSTTASIGISGNSGNFLSVTPLLPVNTSTASSSSENSSISSATNFPSGTVYTFSKPAPSNYLWSENPNNGTLVSNSVNPADATLINATTIYSVTATTSAGCTATENTTVTVAFGVSINSQPLPLIKCTGQNATFTVGATGANLTYQWRKGGSDIDLISNPTAGTNSLVLTNVTDLDNDNYDVVISSTCGAPVTSDAVALTVNPVPTASASSNTPICAGTSLNLTGGTDIGTSFSWTGPNSFVSGSQNPSINPATTAASGTYSFTATANGCTSLPSTITVNVNPSPSSVSVTPSSATICPTSIQQLTASGGIVQTNYLANSGTISLAIPDNNSAGVSSTLSTSVIPASATVDSVIVTLNITHTWDSDVQINLEAPNGQIINLFQGIGSSGDNFTDTRISSNNSMPDFSTGTVPFSGTFKAMALTGLAGVPATTTTTFSDLFTVPDGNWKIRAYDGANGDVGTVNNWSINIYYRAGAITWTPATELFTDAGASVAYVPSTTYTTVYAKPSTSRTYTATSTIGSCSSSGSSALTVSSMVTWTGAANKVWNNPANWCGSVPAITTDILIPAVANLPEIGETTGITNYDGVCRDVTINSGAQITIHPKSSLTVAGNAVLNGTNSIVVKSNTQGTGTLITEAGVSGSGTAQVQRYVTPNQWHFISSPIVGGLSSIFMHAWLKDFVESTNTWNYPNMSVTQPLLIGKGFAIWDTTTAGRVFMFNGLPNTGDITPNPVITFTDAAKGMNLIGNPYPSAIDWDHASWVKTNVDATIYAWNNSGNYIKWNGSIGDLVNGVIPADQAFFVHTNLASPAIIIPNASRCLSTQAFYKSVPADLLVLNAVGNGYNDKTFINFNENATYAFDKEFDGYKLWGIAEAPQLYTYDVNEKYSINVMPSLSPPLTVSMGFKAGVNGNYSITASELNTFDQNILITLEDLKTNQVTDLRQNPVYNFSATSTDDANRFLVHFGRSTTGIDETASNGINIYSFEGNIYINSDGSDGTVYIYNMLGQQLASEKLKPATLNKLKVTTTGYYMVKVVTGKNVSLKKVFCII